MQSFALGQWEPQTRLIPGVGILSAEKKKKKKKKLRGVQLLILRQGTLVSKLQAVSLVKELRLVSWLSTAES